MRSELGDATYEDERQTLASEIATFEKRQQAVQEAVMAPNKRFKHCKPVKVN